MADECDITIPIEVEAQLAATQLDVKPEKRGYESLRGVRRSTYIRRSLLRRPSKAPEGLAAHLPKNGFEEIAKNMIMASASKGRDGAVAVFKECQAALGEKIGTNWRQTMTSARQHMPIVINDLPQPDYSIYSSPNADDEKAN